MDLQLRKGKERGCGRKRRGSGKGRGQGGVRYAKGVVQRRKVEGKCLVGISTYLGPGR